jgi:hypothetical protein
MSDGCRERARDVPGGRKVCQIDLRVRRIRYDVQVEDGLSIDPDKAAVLIQSVLDDKRSWRGTRRSRFDLTPVGQSDMLHAYIVMPRTTDGLCAPYGPWRSVLSEWPSSRSEPQALAARRRLVRI